MDFHREKIDWHPRNELCFSWMTSRRIVGGRKWGWQGVQDDIFCRFGKGKIEVGRVHGTIFAAGSACFWNRSGCLCFQILQELCIGSHGNEPFLLVLAGNIVAAGIPVHPDAAIREFRRKDTARDHTIRNSQEPGQVDAGFRRLVGMESHHQLDTTGGQQLEQIGLLRGIVGRWHLLS